MTSIHLVQLACEAARCKTRYPEQPATYDLEADVAMAGSRPCTVNGVRVLRNLAASAGWEVKRGKQGRDVCPPCRIAEIRSQSNHAEPAAAPSTPEEPAR